MTDQIVQNELLEVTFSQSKVNIELKSRLNAIPRTVSASRSGT